MRSILMKLLGIRIFIVKYKTALNQDIISVLKTVAKIQKISDNTKIFLYFSNIFSEISTYLRMSSRVVKTRLTLWSLSNDTNTFAMSQKTQNIDSNSLQSFLLFHS